MVRCAVCALAGGGLLASLPVLPGPWLAAVMALLALAALSARPLRPLAAVLAGAIVMWGAAHAALADRLPERLSGTDIKFTAKVIEFTRDTSGVSVLLVAPEAGAALPARLRLSWYRAPLRAWPGERWQFTARLRVPRGFANPAGFDYAGWLFRQRIGATGYVRAGQRLAVPDAAGLTTRLRGAFVRRVEQLLPAGDARAVLLAIAAGARHEISRDAWQRYAVTGTSHLVAISGLHVGLAAGAAFLFARLLLAVVLPHGNARDGALLLALAVAASYALFSGFAVPARRALVMAGLVMLAVLWRQRPQPGRILAAACLVVAAADPLSILAPGFILSFAAVAVLLAAAARLSAVAAGDDRPRGRRLLWAGRELLALQLALLLGLFFFTALLFGRVAWLAPAANLAAVPLFSAVAVPASLAGALLGGPFAPAGDLLLWLAWYSLRLVLAVIDALALTPGAARSLAVPQGMALAGFALTGLWAWLPPGWPGRSLAWPALLWAMLYQQPAPPEHCADVHALDVGQGLAVVVRTMSHALVFDTGPAFQSGSDAATLVLLPFLDGTGIRAVDTLVVSHNDMDHAGGVHSLLAGRTVRRRLYGELPARHAAGAEACTAGQRWRWDGIDFAVLHPAVGDRRAGNDASCVLEIAAGEHRALLTGDIERAAEQGLVARQALQKVDVAFVPHHGSRTSSGAAFVQALDAGYALVSAGYRNRWGFPKADVAARWQGSGATVLTTADAGAVTFRLCRNGVTRVQLQRDRQRRFWRAGREQGVTRLPASNR